MKKEPDTLVFPLILAPAGSRDSFLAALAAGADAIYCGLKSFSARMDADNFSIEELGVLATLARKRGVKVYVAFNTLVKPDELGAVGKLIKLLNRTVQPEALIIQDLSLIELARQTGYSGELHLSTLANVSFPRALTLFQKKNLGVNRVVLPRELGIDEIKAMAGACPNGVTLEVFVHGALCYGISGRCYWSSFLGGKSSLRGRCVQPCRRLYSQKRQTQKYFSCQDLSLDVLAKLLLAVPQVAAWKIEGRKKGPHYVYYTVTAYRIFREVALELEGKDPEKKKQALGFLNQALGRSTTHYNFLSHRPQPPIRVDTQTGSGLHIGKVQGSMKSPYLIPREALLAGDLLRVGYEDESGHSLVRVNAPVPKKGRLYLKPGGKEKAANQTPVFLIDRRENELREMIAGLEQELKINTAMTVPSVQFEERLNPRSRKKWSPLDMIVQRKLGRPAPSSLTGVWLPEKDSYDIPRKDITSRCWWWLPPVIWPDEEETVTKILDAILKNGGRNFVLNAPWQIALFPAVKELNVWAGPFCNQANPLSIKVLDDMGYSGVIVSPELSRNDFLDLARFSPLPLGVVISGSWPTSISRTICEELKEEQPFMSPKGEETWYRQHGGNYWIYSNWQLDLTEKKDELIKAGYCLFVTLTESIPQHIQMKQRPGMWNWGLRLL